jgi:uncharacterized protein YdiU (UPF0061 family)
MAILLSTLFVYPQLLFLKSIFLTLELKQMTALPISREGILSKRKNTLMDMKNERQEREDKGGNPMTTNQSGWNIDNSYSRLPKIFYSLQKPTTVEAPELVIFNESLAEELGLNPEALQDEEGAVIFGGNEIPEGGTPLAQAYAGHQFGHFTMLGDGRAVLLGEQITPDGERFDIQLKGSGRTPYSRGGDGRAGLGPMLREFIISEAMVGLGIPTTRSLAVTTTGEEIIRETMQTGAILTRVAASHLRVGTFQFAANWGKTEDLRALADYAIERHYPEVAGEDNRYLSFLKKVIKRQASLIAKWQQVGFIHGVMNTDNMTISGESIDYGPCASWTRMTRRRFSVQLTGMAAMPMGISRISVAGIFRVLLKRYCLYCMRKKMRP